MNVISINSKLKTKIPVELNAICLIAISTKKQINIKNHLEILLSKLFEPFRISDSLKKAIKLPEKVTPPNKNCHISKN